MKPTMPKLLARGLALGLVLSAVVVVRSASPAFACSCLGIERQLAEPGSIQAAFVGSVTDAPDVSGEGSSARLVTWKFSVEDVYRGELPPSIEVKSEASGVSCGFEGIAVGSRIGVLLRREGGAWQSGLCSSGAPEKFAVLGTPSPPKPDAAVPAPTNTTIPVEEDDDDSSRGPLLVALGGAGIVALGIGLLVWRRRRV